MPLFHTDGLLLRDADRDADTRISSVEQVIAVINVVDIYVVVVVPAISPFARPWIHKADPIPAVLKARHDVVLGGFEQELPVDRPGRVQIRR